MKRILLVILLWSGIENPRLSFAQAGRSAEAAVVKITTEVAGSRKVGSGFIVQLAPDLAYIVTAAHVVEGDNQPEVEFFTRRNQPVQASVVGLEGGDPKGLALLLVKGKENLPSGLEAFSLASSVELKGGDEVTIIGFPRSAGPWSVIKGNIVSRQGRDVIFSAAIDEGNSGSPMIQDGRVVGLVTELSEPYGRATPVSSVQLFLKGWGVELMEEAGSRQEPVRKNRGERPTSAFRLRSKPIQIDGTIVEAMMKRYGFSDCKYNPNGDFANQYELSYLGKIRVVVDHTTGLMWQTSGSRTALQNRRECEAYVNQLNQESYAGFSDWRLPTLDELASLAESQKKTGDLCIDPLFDARVRWCWSADTVPGTGASWGMDYSCPHPNLGGRFSNGLVRIGHVRAVRSSQ